MSRRRERLTRERILEAALALVDREGAAALSMRRLASEVGVTPMSLYNHVRGRDELLDGLSEVMVRPIAPRFGDSPREAMARFLHGIRDVARAHPEAFRLVGMRPLHTPAAFIPVEALLGALRALGFEDDDAVHAYRTLVSYARGFALAEIAGFTLESSEATDGARPADLSAHTFHHIVELASQLAHPDHDAAFAFGAELLVDALETRARQAV